jgi:hypothetical protein
MAAAMAARRWRRGDGGGDGGGDDSGSKGGSRWTREDEGGGGEDSGCLGPEISLPLSVEEGSGLCVKHPFSGDTA